MSRVLITVQSLGLGGMEKVAAELSLRLAARGHEVCVVGMYGGGAHEARLREAGVTVQVGLARGRTDLGAIGRLRAICRERRIEFTVAAMGSAMQSPFMTLAACRSAGVPFARWIHSTPGSEPLTATALALQRLMTWMGGPVVALTKSHARALATQWGVPEARLRVVWNGLPLPPRRGAGEAAAVRRELGLGPDEFVVGIVAGFRPVKRHVVLVEAAAEVLRRLPTARFVLVGDGETRPAAEKRAAELGLGTRAMFLGARPDALRLYACMDVHVLCTYPAETFPLVVTESMAAGVVCLCTRVGGIPELIRDGETGVLIEPESPSALAAAIVSLATDPAGRRRMEDAAHDFARAHFSPEAMADGFEAIIRDHARR